MIHILDHTATAMGSRKLKKWLLLPMKDPTIIADRLDKVEAITKDPELLETIRKQLGQMADLERLIAKVAVRRVNPRELVTLKRSLLQAIPLIEALSKSNSKPLKQWAKGYVDCRELIAQIEKVLKEDAPLLINQGKMIKDGGR